jgi:hypothetical protein
MSGQVIFSIFADLNEGKAIENQGKQKDES